MGAVLSRFRAALGRDRTLSVADLERGVSPETAGRIAAGIAFTLTALGVLMIYSHSTFWGAQRFHDPDHFLRTQIMGAVIGLFVFAVTSRIPYRFWGFRARGLLMGSAALLVVVLVFGHRYNGARRWLRIAGVGFQPSELAKIAVVAWAAAFASGRTRELASFRRGFVPAVLPVVLLAGLTLVEPDFGTALFLGALGVAVLVVGGLRILHVLAALASCLPVVCLAMMLRFDYIRERLGFFFGSGTSHQVRQAFIALGSGGVLGKGIGAGTGKLFYLPEVAGDFIFPAIGEELGFVGVVVVLGLFVAFAWCGWRIARAALATDRFGSLLAAGITAWIGMQAVVNLAVVSGAAPTKGIALPFISYGGSSLVMVLGATGILVNVARTADRRRRSELAGGGA